MTTLEIAGIALIVSGTLVGLLRRHGVAWRWPAILATLTLLYYVLAPTHEPRQGVILALVFGWAAHHVYWVRRERAAQPTPVVAPLWRETAMVLLASATMLTAMTEPEQTWRWTDVVGLAAFGIGLFLSFRGTRWTARRHLDGENVMAWSLFAFAFVAPSGMVTIFAPLITVSLLKRAYSS